MNTLECVNLIKDRVPNPPNLLRILRVLKAPKALKAHKAKGKNISFYLITS